MGVQLGQHRIARRWVGAAARHPRDGWVSVPAVPISSYEPQGHEVAWKQSA